MRRLSAPNILIFCIILRWPGICTGGMVPFPAFSHQTGDTLDRNVEYHHRRDCFFFLSGASIGRNRRIMAGNVWKTSRWRNFTIFSRYIFQKTAKIMIANGIRSCYNTECVRRRATLTLGCRQAVRHQTLTLAFVGSNPAIPAIRSASSVGRAPPF